MRMSLIVSTYNWVNALEKVFAAIRAQTVSPDELLIADDGSNEETRISVSRFRQQYTGNVQHVWHEDKGFRKASILNKSIAAATSTYIVFLDGDCVPHSKFIEDHIAVSEESCWVQGRRAFISQDRIDDFKGRASSFCSLWIRGGASGFFKSVRWPLPWSSYGKEQRGILGCNMGVWKEDLIAVNGFDEEYEGWGKEDSDLGARLYNLGLLRKTVYGRAIVYHLNHSEFPRDSLAKNQDRLQLAIEGQRITCERGLSQYL